ncbi:MAG: hypothetical protein ABR970_14410 [Roseiarcus sp.]
MIRLLRFLAFLCLAALGFAWLADHPGQVGLTWQGYRVETSVMVPLAGVVALAVVIALLWGIFALLRGTFRATRN